MLHNNLDMEFEEAFKIASNLPYLIPQDVMLRLYAFYKKATLGQADNHHSSHELIRAFKANAIMQVNHLTKEEAQKEYIKLVNEITKLIQ